MVEHAIAAAINGTCGVGMKYIRKNQLFSLHLIISYSSYPQSYSSYFGGKKGISGNKMNFFFNDG